MKGIFFYNLKRNTLFNFYTVDKIGELNRCYLYYTIAITRNYSPTSFIFSKLCFLQTVCSKQRIEHINKNLNLQTKPIKLPINKSKIFNIKKCKSMLIYALNLSLCSLSLFAILVSMKISNKNILIEVAKES